jgi:hypothetical protein
MAKCELSLEKHICCFGLMEFSAQRSLSVVYKLYLCLSILMIVEKVDRSSYTGQANRYATTRNGNAIDGGNGA